MPYVIAEPCVDVKDKSCLEEWPVDAIYEGGRMLYIHPGECIDAVPARWSVRSRRFTTWTICPNSGSVTYGNADFFEELGSPGGASNVGVWRNDPPAVKDLPPMGSLNGRHTRKDMINEILRGER